MKFVMQRNRTVSSVLGHSVEFKKGEPTHVPPELYAEVMAVGAIPEEELDLDPKSADKTTEPNDPIEREAMLFMAFDTIALRGKREDFTAGGQPHPKALESELGWKVSNKERDIAWVKFKNQAPE